MSVQNQQDNLPELPINQSCDNNEPLGYKDFLHNVNIEFKCNSYSFKLKCIPYLIEFRKNKSVSSVSDSSSITNNCDHLSSSSPSTSSSSSKQNYHYNQTNQLDDNNLLINQQQLYNLTTPLDTAFLSNSDYCPTTSKNVQQKVLLELISAKLSTASNLSHSTSHTSLVTLSEQQNQLSLEQNGQTVVNNNNTPFSNNNSITDLVYSNDNSNVIQLSNSNSSTINPPASPITSISSKRYVNYTILIKTTPGLDKNPAVIERRFSDFLKLYQGLKSSEPLANIIEDNKITFPKKVYMGNFSLTNIAERAIEFQKVLNLCMSDINFFWSTPFVSFLLDNELIGAQRALLFGDLDELQALIETAYNTETKLYLNYYKNKINNNDNDNNNLIDVEYQNSYGHNNSSPQLNGSRSDISNANCTISIANENSNIADNNNNNDNNDRDGNKKITNISSSNDSIITEPDNSALMQIKKNLTPLNQRLLATFVLKFICSKDHPEELKLAIQSFSQMISSDEFIDSLLNTSHYLKSYKIIKACILFIININKGNVIDENQRLWLKEKLEFLDYWCFNNDNDISNNVSSDGNRDRKSIISNSSTTRIKGTLGGLISLVKSPEFCSFQDGKFVI